MHPPFLFSPQRFQRRHFLRTVSGLVAGALGARLARADELPKNTNPRAISGDSVEPDWKQRLTITVGPKDADLVGATDRVIQAGGGKGVAIDINGETESVSVIQNELRETRAPLSRIGILIAAETRDIRCVENRIEGLRMSRG